VGVLGMIPFSLGFHIIASASTIVAFISAKKVKEDKERV
jgi:hypothetical protein